MIYSAKVIKYSDNIDTDVIIPARFLNTSDKSELAKHCMEDLDSDFAQKVKDGARIILAGKNFGSGSSREHAPVALKSSGIELIIAEGFARIFFRNSINIGLPIVECQAVAGDADEGDTISFDTDTGIITNETKQKQYTAAAFPEFLQNIISAGGLLNSIKAGDEK